MLNVDITFWMSKIVYNSSNSFRSTPANMSVCFSVLAHFTLIVCTPTIVNGSGLSDVQLYFYSEEVHCWQSVSSFEGSLWHNFM